MVLIEEIKFDGINNLRDKINALVKGGYEFVQILKVDTWGLGQKSNNAIVVLKTKE